MYNYMCDYIYKYKMYKSKMKNLARKMKKEENYVHTFSFSYILYTLNKRIGGMIAWMFGCCLFVIYICM